MKNSRLLKHIEDYFASDSDITFFKNEISETIKNEKHDIVKVKFEPNYKFLAFYYILTITLPIEKIEVICDKQTSEVYKEDIKMFEVCFSKIKISDETPTYYYTTKTDVLFNKGKPESLFAGFYNNDIYLFGNFNNDFVFSENGETFISDKNLKTDIFLKTLEFNSINLSDEQVEAVLQKELILKPKDFLTQEDLDDFLKEISKQ